MRRIGIIGGSALYDLEGIKVRERVHVKTPFGKPSDAFVTGKMYGKDVVFLSRHGQGHKILPSELNYRANIYGFKALGVDRILSVSAVGSLKEEIKPLDVLLVDQFIDRTNQARKTTFFGEGIVAHVAFADPVCWELRNIIFKANKKLDVKIHNGGTYLNMEGPAFSTKAESHLYRSWGLEVIGMTNLPEARLAKEAGICYATIALVTDYDSWHLDEAVEDVTVEMIMENLNKNIENAKKILASTIKSIPDKRKCGCGSALKNAIITARKHVPKATLKKLGPIVEGFI